MKVFVSNKLTALAELLLQILSKCDNPLANRWVIVPSEEVKLDLYLKWLETSDIVTGIKTITYSELIRKMLPELPSKMELALRIETALGSIHELQHYLGDSLIKKIELASELSSLFLKYLQRPTQELVEWMAKEGWQQTLWKEVFGKTPPTAVIRPLSGTFYFYNITHINPYEMEAFSQMETAWFVFSPSEMYIGDLVPERQQKFLLGKVKESVKGNLAEYFEKDSPLLSNWITEGQTLLQYFEDAETTEYFIEPEGTSALHQLQLEWLTLQKERSPPDSSIQLHSVSNLLREVEVVWEIIQRLPYKPREIVVFAPDIQPYAATIEWVFKHRGGPFDYSITGIEARSHSPLLQELELLLSLPAHRFSHDAFKKLLFCAPFLKKFDLTIEDAKTLDAWMTDVHLRYDLTGHTGSWHAALKRVIEGLVLSGSFDFSDTPLINRFIEITIKLEALTDREKRSGQEWAHLIESWIEMFFASDEETDILRSFLTTLRSERVSGLFTYETIEHHLKAAFTNPSGSMHRSSLDTVRFTSLKNGAVVPAKAILCMGMQEGSFPRIDTPSSLPELPTPNRITEDRYLFLEAVSHAEEKLIVTYQRCHPDDGKEMHPSPIIQELIKDRGGITTTHHATHATLPRKISATHKPLTPSTKKIIDIRVLRKLARHPVQCFLEEGVGLRFPWDETDSEFLFSPLEMHTLRKKSLKMTTSQLIDQLDKEGKLPSGAFRKVALQSIEKELDTYRKTLAQIGIDPSSVFSLELTPHAKVLKRISDDFMVAPILKIGDIQLQGIIEGLTPQGILCHGEESMEDLLKIWPLYVITLAVLGKTSLLLTKKGVITDIPLVDPLETLERYIGYLQKSLQTPSPLLPAWGRRIFKGGELPSSTDDDILLWAGQRNLLPPHEKWVDEWRPYLQEVVRELI
jgi:exonuclease V gamma subunit